jgi:hypothetical protein
VIVQFIHLERAMLRHSEKDHDEKRSENNAAPKIALTVTMSRHVTAMMRIELGEAADFIVQGQMLDNGLHIK